MEEGKNDNLTNENLEPEIAKIQEEAKIEGIEKTKETEENRVGSALIEVKTKKEKKKRKGSYLLGNIGAILGGAVATLPWILAYIFASHMVIPLFATFIPVGTYLGYKIFNGKTKKLFPVIITIISLLLIILVTTVICPSVLLLQSSYPITLENLLGLYSDTREEIRETIIGDLIIGILFSIMGIVVIIKAFIIKRKTIEEKILIQQEKQNKLREQSQIIKNACLDLESMAKEKAVKKKIILKQITRVYHVKLKKAKLYFINSKKNRLLKKYRGKYYYDEINEEVNIAKVKKLKKRYISKMIKFFVTLIITIIVALAAYMIINKKDYYPIKGAGIEIGVDKTQDFYGTIKDIIDAFGEEFASYYDFIIMDKELKYELYGLEIPDSNYQGKDFATIMQEDRDYFAPYLGEESISQVEDRKFGKHALKVYYYTYTGTDGNQYRAGIYLYDGESTYLWINMYADLDIENAQLDSIIDKLIK